MSESSEQQEGLPSHQTILKFHRGPTTTIKQGSTFAITVTVDFGCPWNHLRTGMQAFAVNISLVNELGICPQGRLKGSLTMCLQPTPGYHARGVAVFDNLIVGQVGTHRLCALLGVSSSHGMSIETREHSRAFRVSQYLL
jgi:hypothetical protein